MATLPYTYMPVTTGGTTASTWLNTWESWNSQATTGGYWQPVTATTIAWTSASTTAWGGWNTAYEETAEQAARRVQRQAELDNRAAEHREQLRRRNEEYRQRRDAISQRARDLLLSLLTPEQAGSYVTRRWFDVRGSRGGRYRIRDDGQAGNVDLMPDIGEQRIMSFCCHPPGGRTT